MGNSAQIGLVAFCILLSGGDLGSASTSPVPREWEAFRSKFPYHIQGVALSEPRADGTRVLIVAEPPPHVTLTSLRALSPELANLQPATQRIGHDGWVKDAVVTLPRSDGRALSSLCQKINRHLFDTSYKSYVLAIPNKITTPPPVMPPARYQLDYKISAAELQRWLLTDRELFRPVEGGAPRTLPDLMAAKGPGVFLSETKGLVAWIIPDDTDLRDYAIEAREFSLDSDLIVGAVLGAQGKAVLGRERAIPVDEMPPLRSETAFLLAAANTSNLAQSYERNNAFAGRLDKSNDWAPIFLSPELIDTEFGSLLNVTDQLLKSWSNCGVTEYENFRYAKPDHWPFGKPLPQELGVDEIVYNWNTKGATYAIAAGPYALLALNRTGALPVSYFPSGGSSPESISKAEDAAYMFFAGIGDVSLARVVQYTALYQIFANLGIQASGDKPDDADGRTSDLLEAEATKLLTELKDSDEDGLSAIAAHRMQKITDAAFREQIDSEISFALSEKQYAAGIKQMRADVTQELVKKLGALRLKLPDQHSEEFRQCVSTLIASGQPPEFADFLRSASNLTDLRERLVKFHPPKSGTWIHTPAVVISFNAARMANYVGGHNIDAIVSVFRTSKEVPLGEVKIVKSIGGTPELLCNESDVPKVSAFVRKVGRNSEDIEKVLPQLQAELKSMPAPRILDQREALGFALDRSLPSERGLQPALMPKIAEVETGWQPRPLSTADVQRLRPYALESRSALVEYKLFPDGRHQVSYLPSGDTTGGLVTSTREQGEVADIIQVCLRKHADANQPPTIVFRGTTADEAYAMTKQLEFEQAKIKSRPLRICAGEKMEPEAIMSAVHEDYDFSNATIARVSSKVASGRNELAFELKIPAMDPMRPTLRMHLRIIFEKILGPEVVAEIEARVSNLLARLTRQHRLPDLHFELHKELDPLLRNHGVQGDFRFQIDTEKGDLIITLHSVHNVAALDRVG